MSHKKGRICNRHSHDRKTTASPWIPVGQWSCPDGKKSTGCFFIGETKTGQNCLTVFCVLFDSCLLWRSIHGKQESEDPLRSCRANVCWVKTCRSSTARLHNEAPLFGMRLQGFTVYDFREVSGSRFRISSRLSSIIFFRNGRSLTVGLSTRKVHLQTGEKTRPTIVFSICKKTFYDFCSPVFAPAILVV